YVSNNPARYIDPSGHGECDPNKTDCEPIDCEVTLHASACDTLSPEEKMMRKIYRTFGITFTSDSGKEWEWDIEELKTVYNALLDIGKKLARILDMNNAGDAFRKLFGTSTANPITFHMSKSDCACYAETGHDTRTITFYGGNPKFNLSKALIAHELGHYLNKEHGNFGRDAYLDWMDSGEAPTLNQCFASGKGTTFFGGTFPEDKSKHASEKFADMFQAWVYPENFTKNDGWQDKCQHWAEVTMWNAFSP
ncbi:MAG: hypothetical protein OEZ02_15350, partial [Anaerolineae bacterium]|nr:hypothetical protein [Anaerolineae bacterium]